MPRTLNRKGGVFACVLILFLTLGLALLAGLLYEVRQRPAWLGLRADIPQDMHLVKIEVPLDISRPEAAERNATEKAKRILLLSVAKKAREQIETAYGWDTLDEATRLLTAGALKEALHAETADSVSLIGHYPDWPDGTWFALYGMDNADIDATLQRIYERVNKKVLASMHFGEDEIPEETSGDTRKESEDENTTATF